MRNEVDNAKPQPISHNLDIPGQKTLWTVNARPADAESVSIIFNYRYHIKIVYTANITQHIIVVENHHHDTVAKPIDAPSPPKVVKSSDWSPQQMLQRVDNSGCKLLRLSKIHEELMFSN